MGGCNNNTIGGVVPGAGNLVSDNLNGVHLYFADVTNHDNTVQGNLIGTDVTGTVALGNHLAGVDIQNADANLIGGNTAAARNVVSGNLDSGFAIYGGPAGTVVGSANNNRIEGNFIGTNAAGTAKLANARDGISITITQGSAANTIGGATTDKRNIISGNGRNGIAIGIRLIDPNTGQLLPGTGGTGITIQNNYVGTDVTGNNCLGNTQDGIFVDADSTTNTISDNLVTCNGRNGVLLPQNSNPAVRIFIDNNSVFANAALGIDLGLAGITANDPLDTDGGANLQQNFPVLTSFAAGSASMSERFDSDLVRGADLVSEPHSPEAAVTVNGTLNSSPNTTFTVHWYFANAPLCTSNQETSRPLVTGKVPNVSTNAQGDAQFSFPLDFPGGIAGGTVNTTATDPNGNTSEFSKCFAVNAATPQTVQFTSGTANVSETLNATTKVDLNVTRSGDTSGPATVNYASADGTASDRSDYLAAVGTLRFAAGETAKTVSVFIVDDRFGEGAETFNVTLSNPVGLVLGTPASVTVTINSNETVDGLNPVRDPNFSSDFFVRQHYTDFFNRAADGGGLGFWKNQIDECTTQECRELRRINVSAAFFLSIEFQETGYLVYKSYQATTQASF